MSRILENAPLYHVILCFGGVQLLFWHLTGREIWSLTFPVFPTLIYRKERRIIALKSAIPDRGLFSPQFSCSCHQPVQLCTLKDSRTEVGPSVGPVPRVWSLPQSKTAGWGGILSPWSAEPCQTPKQLMCLNLPEPLASELKNTLQRCHFSGKCFESLAAAFLYPGLYICIERARSIQPGCDLHSVPRVPCWLRVFRCPKPGRGQARWQSYYVLNA